MVKYFIGPMSKNIVDSVIEFYKKTNHKIGFIPSRRQIDWNNGYVNNWDTEKFRQYVSVLPIKRDHSGPNQGTIDDDGYESLKHDSIHFEYIHIDPWKKYPIFSDGLEETIKMINYCYNINPNIKFEVGTEEAIRRFEPYELSDLMHQLKNRLSTAVYNQIKYLVIQSGTSLKNTIQTGNYDPERLKEMLLVCKNFNVLSKEHNGDYIPVKIIHEKFSMGLDSINIAPEFGVIETQTYLDEIKNNEELFEIFWNICYLSNKWKKWVDDSFDPIKNKTELIKICGHYVFSYPEFIEKVKSKFPNIDNKIQLNILQKLHLLYGFEA